MWINGEQLKMRIEVVILLIVLQIVSFVKTQPTINMSEAMSASAELKANLETVQSYDVTGKTGAHSEEFTAGTQDVVRNVMVTTETVSDQDQEELEGEGEYYEEDDQEEDEGEEQEEGNYYYDGYTDNDDVIYDGYNDEEYDGDEYPEDDDFEYSEEYSNTTLDSYKEEHYLNGTSNNTHHKGARRGKCYWLCNQ